MESVTVIMFPEALRTSCSSSIVETTIFHDCAVPFSLQLIVADSLVMSVACRLVTVLQVGHDIKCVTGEVIAPEPENISSPLASYTSYEISSG